MLLRWLDKRQCPTPAISIGLAPSAGHSIWLDQHPLYHLAWLLKRDTAWDVVTSRRPTIRCIAGHVERLDTMI